MVAEAIERIRNAEREGEELERAARAQGKALIADAHDAAERSLDEARKAGWEEETYPSEVRGCARVYPHQIDSGGGFVARLERP